MSGAQAAESTPVVVFSEDLNDGELDNNPTWGHRNNEALVTELRAVAMQSVGSVVIDDIEVKVRPPVLDVLIDIKPGSDPNCFNSNGNGVIPVAILGGADFNVTEIDASTVALESLAVKAVGKSNKLLAHFEDINSDGFDDLVVQIEDSDGGFSSGSTTATLSGNLLPEFGGTPLEGTDAICIVP